MQRITTIAKNINILNQVYGFENITIRCLGVTELINLAKRLTRFENPIRKHFTLSKNVLFKASVSPKISNKTVVNLVPASMDSLVNCIWDSSLNQLGYETSMNYDLNLYLAYEDIKIFSAQECLKELLFSGSAILSEHPLSINRFTDLSPLNPQHEQELKMLLNDNAYDVNLSDDERLKDLNAFEKLYIAYKLSYPLNLEGLVKLVKENNGSVETKVPEIARLVELDRLIRLARNNGHPNDYLKSVYKLSSSQRNKLQIAYPPRMILLVEGITEELLLPRFAKLLTYDFNTDGILVISSGGKNQVNKMYNKLKRQLKIPVAILLDSDAEAVSDDIKPILRDNDKLLVIQKGEFEDLLSRELICRVVNKEFSLSPGLKLSEIDEQEPIVKQLCQIWKYHGLGDFSKSDFAHIILNNLDDKKYLTQSMIDIIEEIYSIL